VRSLALVTWLLSASPDAGRQGAPCPEPPPAGRLTVSTDPWTIAHVDGERWGDTPIVARSLAAGRHRLRLENTVYGVDETRSIDIVEGETLRVNLKLETKLRSR
jgi:hypothetical protein